MEIYCQSEIFGVPLLGGTGLFQGLHFVWELEDLASNHQKPRDLSHSRQTNLA